MTTKNYAISETLANKIIRYLGNRPMIEVEDMVIGLRNIQPIVLDESPKTEE